MSLSVASPALLARVPEFPEPSTGLSQEVPGTPDLDDATLVQHHDAVKVGDRVQAMGDGEDAVVLELLADEVLDRLLGVDVNTGLSLAHCRLPREDHTPDVLSQDGPGKEEELSLSMAQCLFVELGVQPAILADRLPEPEVREGRLYDGVVSGDDADGVKVLSHRAGEYELLLGDGDEGRPQGQQREGVQRRPVDRNGAGGQRQETEEGEEEGGLSASRAAHDADLLAGADGERDPVQGLRRGGLFAVALARHVIRGGNVTELYGTTARPAVHIRLRHRATSLRGGRHQCRPPQGIVLDLVRGLLGEVLDARDGTDGCFERGPELDQHLESLGEGDKPNETPVRPTDTVARRRTARPTTRMARAVVVRSRTRVSHCWVSRRM
ncbi:uncharacterized protein GLRG_06071 [Colletotrichum graminicola M1.001]|uniref:Uncharacterized protein n=1 Tax=Colletotrichum graminicola (strain M1.001 / M2 / FGSC 10212) TaxID=645133 RepID=E3QJ89_COLGM|nr:uncharacterized protein GLRG_06071 [Colletotrichum graminicola M1.001]EFQ30927.1 hypothetical protein GLRG_06071 [Colletotrichum graminicola M1.001]